MGTLFQQDKNFDKFVTRFIKSRDKLREISCNFGVRKVAEHIGLKVIGSGHFSCVFECPWDNKKVIKVSNALEDGWLIWAAFALKHRGTNNPLLPEIYNLRLEKDFYFAVLKKYSKVIGGYRARNSDMRSKIITVERTIQDRPAYEDHHPEYSKHVDQLRKLAGKDDLLGLIFRDVHNENIMVHRGRVILIDPCSRNSMPYHKDLKTLGVKIAA